MMAAPRQDIRPGPADAMHPRKHLPTQTPQKLATLAKITAGPLQPGQTRVCCVYTPDFNDRRARRLPAAGGCMLPQLVPPCALPLTLRSATRLCATPPTGRAQCGCTPASARPCGRRCRTATGAGGLDHLLQGGVAPAEKQVGSLHWQGWAAAA